MTIAEQAQPPAHSPAANDEANDQEPTAPPAASSSADATDSADEIRELDEQPQPRTTPCAPGLPGDIPDPDDINNPALYLNRELTWLNFNWRVLYESDDSRNPLLERIKFLSIFSSNLDEFFMKRIGGLKQQVGAGMHERTVDGMNPRQQISTCYKLVTDMEAQSQSLLDELRTQLREHGIELAEYDRLSDDDQAFVRKYYLENIFPLATPQAMDPAHPFPFVSNLSLNLLVTLHYPRETEPLLARVKVPVGGGIPRLLRVGTRNTFVRLEEVMAHNLDLLFPGMEIESCELFRVTRNANTEMDEDQADDLLAMIETELRERKFAPIVRLEVGKDMSPGHRGMLAAELGLDRAADVFEVDGVLGIGDLMELTALDLPHLKDPPHHPVAPPDLFTEGSIFHVIRDAGSLLVHHPYESFANSVERFLLEASLDPKVLAIKMTMYRTAADSLVIKHLINAARNGKQVAVVLELKAKFDEEANIRWANHLEQSGIHVTYGVVGLKTHCKVILVVRQDYDGLRRYAHIGTGNYHSGTARLYSDFGLFTSRNRIGSDLTELFNYLTTGYKPRRNYRRILPAPKILKGALLEKIGREIRHRRAGAEALIQMKMNALEDIDVTRALYRAAQAGVKIDLIVRDTCRLRPGLPGWSESVTVICVIGRFLEHARVLYFHNGGDEEYYIGSADCMQRNLESRVETLVPVRKPELQRELRHFLDNQLADQRSAWEMRPDGSYVQRMPAIGKKSKGSQQLLIEHAERRYREATRLKRRKTKGIAKRRLR